MARLIVFIVLLIQCASSWATVVARNGTELGVRAPASAVHARQTPGERLVGRVDCALPEPGTNVCPCGSDWELCGVLCRNTEFDVNHCGACDDSACTGGEGAQCCSGVCSDALVDPKNCGACGTVCDVAGGEVCCGGKCADTLVNPEHCGHCFNSCTAGTHCVQGKCTPKA